jgi:hypothetical protein
MRRLHPWAIAVWLGSAASGCAVITGLDSLAEQDCAPYCGDAQSGDTTARDGEGSGYESSSISDRAMAVIDSSSEHSSAEAAPSRDAPAETLMGTDAGGSGQDAARDAPGDSAPVDVVLDVALDVTSDVPTRADAGCGPLDVVTNCSACGEVCDPLNATKPECSGTTCSYTCNTGYVDCNSQTNPPDTDGCECRIPGGTVADCCSGACPVGHNYDQDITSGGFYDCVAAGTYNGTIAKDACAAFAGGAGSCSDWTCTSYADGGLIADMVCSDGPGAPACACWAYDGDLLGHMVIGPGTAATDVNNCQCPLPTDPHWD